MSIITDALRKAEAERELKAKRTADETASIATLTALEEEISEKISMVPAAPPKFLSESQSENQWPKILVVLKETLANQPSRKYALYFLAGIFLLVFFCLLLIPRKPAVILQSGTKSRNAQATELPYVLSGISSAGDNHYAIINGVIVQQGDSIDGAHVKAVLDNEAVLETRAGEFRLKIEN